MLLLAGLIVFFAYFYTAIQFDPVRTADNLRKHGRVHPRHPSRAADGRLPERHPRADHAAGVAVPRDDRADPDDRARTSGGLNQFPFGGTSILIAVGVALETMKQIESQLMMRHYEGFLS